MLFRPWSSAAYNHFYGCCIIRKGLTKCGKFLNIWLIFRTILLAIIFGDLALLRTYVQFKAFVALRENQQQNVAGTNIPMFGDVQNPPSLSVLSNYSQNNETKEDWDQNPPSYNSITHSWAVHLTNNYQLTGFFCHQYIILDW